MGPLNNEPTAEKMDEHVADALERGAELVAGRQRAQPASRPTSTGRRRCSQSVTEEMEVAREETFGPVVPITRISSDEEALQIANASPYGLLTAVWTRDLARGLRFAEAVDAGLGEHQRVDELLGEPPSLRRPRGNELGRRPRRRRSVLETFTEPKTVVLTLG